MEYIYKVIRRVLNIALIIVGVYIGAKMAVFYMPFLVAFVISLMIEPGIKYLMKKTKFFIKAKEDEKKAESLKNADKA